MTTLLGILCFHLLVLVRAKQTEQDGIPYLSTLFLTIGLIAFVITMMFNTDVPEL